MSKKNMESVVQFDMRPDLNVIAITRDEYKRLIRDSEVLTAIRLYHENPTGASYMMDALLEAFFGKSGWKKAEERKKEEEKTKLIVADIYSPFAGDDPKKQEETKGEGDA